MAGPRSWLTPTTRVGGERDFVARAIPPASPPPLSGITISAGSISSMISRAIVP